MRWFHRLLLYGLYGFVLILFLFFMIFFGVDLLETLWDHYPKWIVIIHLIATLGSFFLLILILDHTVNILKSLIIKQVNPSVVIQRLQQQELLCYAFSVINIINLFGMYVFADQEDAPGILLFMLMIIAISFMFGMILGVIKRYLIDSSKKIIN